MLCSVASAPPGVMSSVVPSPVSSVTMRFTGSTRLTTPVAVVTSRAIRT